MQEREGADRADQEYGSQGQQHRKNNTVEETVGGEAVGFARREVAEEEFGDPACGETDVGHDAVENYAEYRKDRRVGQAEIAMKENLGRRADGDDDHAGDNTGASNDQVVRNAARFPP